MNKIEQDFFILFGGILKNESSGEFMYNKTSPKETLYFPEDYSYNYAKIEKLMEKSVKDKHDYVYDLTKDVPKKVYKDGCYY